MNILNQITKISAKYTPFRSNTTLTKSAVADLFVIVSIMIVVFLFRLEDIFYLTPLNSDEAQIAANTLRLKLDLIPWRAVDGTTVGPLNYYIMTWPMWFSEPVTLQSVRITGVFLIILSLVVTYKTARLYLSISRAFIPVTIVALFEALTGAHDFVHYGSEIVSVFLFCIVTYLIAQSINVYNFKKLCIGLFIAGLIPFAKLQSAPLVLYVGIFVLVFEYLYQKRRNQIQKQKYLYLAISAIAPAVLILLPVLLTGNLDEFWKSYIAWGLMYKDNALNLAQFIELIFGIPTYAYAFAGLFFLSFYTVISVLIFRGGLYDNQNRTFLVYATGFLLVSIYIVIAPGRMFLHYLTFMLPGVMLVNIALLSSLPSLQISNVFAKRLVTIILPIGIAILVAVRIAGVSGKEEMNKVDPYRYPALYTNSLFQKQNLLDWLPVKNNYMLVWGWMPQWYLYAGKIPASRETQTEQQIRNIHDNGYKRRRLLSDIKQSVPSIIIDAVVQGSFKFSDNKKFGISSFKELDNIVVNNYQIVNKRAFERYECPAIYIKTRDLQDLNSKMIVPMKITASAFKSTGKHQYPPDRVNDNSVFEECDDYWLLPDHSGGTLQMTYEAAKLNEIWILNTMGENGDRSTRAVTLKVYTTNNNIVEKKVSLEKYPVWTKVKLPETVTSTKTQIEISDYFGIGAGLNEVKLFCNQCK